MDWFRSAEMDYVSIIVQEHIAHDAVGKLGDLGAIQFTDLNEDLTPFQRRYTKFIRRCDELERMLRHFEDAIEHTDLEIPEASMDEFASWLENQRQSGILGSRRSMLEMWEQELRTRYDEYSEMATACDELRKAYFQMVEHRYVIEKAARVFEYEAESELMSDVDLSAAEAAIPRPTSRRGDDIRTSLMSAHGETLHDAPTVFGDVEAARDTSGMRFRNLAGVVAEDERITFERMLFRVSRGNCYVRFEPIEEEIEDEKGNMVRIICESHSANRHELPDFDNRSAVESTIQDLEARLQENEHIRTQNENMAFDTLRAMSQVLDKWRKGVRREKCIHTALNKFESFSHGMLRAKGWVIREKRERVSAVLRQSHAGQAGGPSLPVVIELERGKWPKPPTHFDTNKFTSVFQAVVDTYGVPRYREANPALFAAVTFPFLFGVMYGDVGHSTLLFVASLIIVLMEKTLQNKKLGEMVSMVFAGRYMLLLMGFFGIYCGFIYNDCFSIGMTLFESRWEFNEAFGNSTRVGGIDDVYPFGIDPAWHRAQNELLFFNSFKMKLSVIIGVIQMTFGLLLKAGNAHYFGNKLDLWCECVPQIVFMLALFGYMVLCIVYKWGVNWAQTTRRPPDLIDTMIGIVLSPGSVSQELFDGQSGVHAFILFVAFVCIPLMLLVKPYVLWKRHQQQPPYAAHGTGMDRQALLRTRTESMDSRDTFDTVAPAASAAVTAESHVASPGHDEDEEEFDLMEVAIHQAIETIEFVLGCISNTASYLRLWALSLAHTQLASVFWNKALVESVGTGNPVAIVIGFGAFAGITFGVLLIMDVLECFLHALRLHWVEFQNKFYKADGYKFQPFDFHVLLSHVHES